jgi:hypothetical protein
MARLGDVIALSFPPKPLILSLGPAPDVFPDFRLGSAKSANFMVTAVVARSKESGYGTHGSNLSSGFRNYSTKRIFFLRRAARGCVTLSTPEKSALSLPREFCQLSDFRRMHAADAQEYILGRK